jgi:hypothetical protein
MLAILFKVTKDERYRYYIYETVKYMFDLHPEQSDVYQMNEYACPSSSAFIDSQFVTMNFISDFLTFFDSLESMWMLGFGDLPPS